MGTTPADLEALQSKLMARYDSGSWGQGFPDDPSAFGRVFQNFTDVPDPSEFGTHTSKLLSTMEKLAGSGFSTQTSHEGKEVLGTANSVLDTMLAAGIEVEDWTGKASDTFFEWTTGWRTGISNQFAAAQVLRTLLHAEAAIWTAALDDLKRLGDAAHEALEAADDTMDTGSGDLKVTLQIVGALVAVGSAVPTGGASLSIMSAVGAGITVASTGMDLVQAGSTKTAQINACCPREILSSLQDAVREVEAQVLQAETEINTELDKNISVIADNWSKFCHPAPALASVPRNHIHAYDHMGNPPGAS